MNITYEVVADVPELQKLTAEFGKIGSNLNQIMDYMLFQHDEFTMKPVLDENGRMMLREEYYIDGINRES